MHLLDFLVVLSAGQFSVSSILSSGCFIQLVLRFILIQHFQELFIESHFTPDLVDGF